MDDSNSCRSLLTLTGLVAVTEWLLMIRRALYFAFSKNIGYSSVTFFQYSKIRILKPFNKIVTTWHTTDLKIWHFQSFILLSCFIRQPTKHGKIDINLEYWWNNICMSANMSRLEKVKLTSFVCGWSEKVKTEGQFYKTFKS